MLLQQSDRISQVIVRFSMALLVALALAAPPQPAAAQDEEFDLNERLNSLEIPLEPPLIKANVVGEIIKAIGLDESQGELVRALHQGYVDQFTQAATTHRDRLQSLMEEFKDLGGMNPAGADVQQLAQVGLDMQTEQREWMDRRTQVGKSFFENVKATLTSDQLARWPKFERDRRRHTQLGVGSFFAGEGVDVIKLVDDLKLEGPQLDVIVPLLESYSIELDGLLQQRIRAAEDVRNIDYTDPGAQMNMFEKFERVLAVRRQIRDTNRKHSQVIATSIPGPASEQLTRKFREESYPRIYRPTEADAFFQQVFGLDDLSDDQRRGIEGVAMMYRDQVATANQGLAQLLADHEDSIEESLKDNNQMMLAMAGAMSSLADESVSQEQMPFDSKELLMDEEQAQRQDDLNRQKRSYVVAAIEQAWAVLNSAQQDRVPMPDVPEETPEQKALRQVRTMMRQQMEYAEDIAREAAEQQGDTKPLR